MDVTTVLGMVLMFVLFAVIDTRQAFYTTEGCSSTITLRSSEVIYDN